QRQRRRDRARASARRDRRDAARHAARRARAAPPEARPGHTVRRRRHGHRDDHRAAVMMQTIRCEIDDGIATLTLDAPGSAVNTMTAQWQADLAQAVAWLEAEKARIRG